MHLDQTHTWQQIYELAEHLLVLRGFAEDTIRVADVRLQLTLDGGKHRLAWPLASGKFSFQEVPHGSHLLDVLAVGMIYPQVPGWSFSLLPALCCVRECPGAS